MEVFVGQVLVGAWASVWCVVVGWWVIWLFGGGLCAAGFCIGLWVLGVGDLVGVFLVVFDLCFGWCGVWVWGRRVWCWVVVVLCVVCYGVCWWVCFVWAFGV